MYHIQVCYYGVDNLSRWLLLAGEFMTFSSAWAAARRLDCRCRIVGSGNCVEV
jgi:hypothetical protein